jgi:hypothetical protein
MEMGKMGQRASEIEMIIIAYQIVWSNTAVRWKMIILRSIWCTFCDFLGTCAEANNKKARKMSDFIR